jgi:type IV fimbrial biogenesis protein FimT
MVRGFTLVELLVAMVVMAVLVSAIIPSFAGFGANTRLTAAAEQVHAHLQQARSEALTRSAPTFVNFADTGDTDWTYGMSLNPGCAVAQTDPTAAGSCVLVVDDGDGSVDPGDGSVDTGDLVLSRSVGADHTDVRMVINNFSSGTSDIRFDPVRGTSDTGDIRLFASNGNQLVVRVNTMGQSRICSPDGSMGAYTENAC